MQQRTISGAGLPYQPGATTTPGDVVFPPSASSPSTDTNMGDAFLQRHYGLLGGYAL